MYLDLSNNSISDLRQLGKFVDNFFYLFVIQLRCNYFQLLGFDLEKMLFHYSRASQRFDNA